MKSVDNVEQLIKRANAVPGSGMNRRTLNDIFEAQEESKKKITTASEPNILRMILFSRAGSLAAALLVISSLAACFVLSGKVKELNNELKQARRDVAVAETDDSATINLYLKEHQDVVAQHASNVSTATQASQIRVNQHDIMYYELFDDGPEYMRPGIIVKGPSSQQEINASEAPAISNGHSLSLSEARETADFDLVAPSWLRPCYRLDQIRRIEGRDALQLLYTDGIKSLSLFEQPLDGRRKLEPRDFREYAVYRNKGQTGGTILTWRDDSLSYVLTGNTELSQLMDIAQSINAVK